MLMLGNSDCSCRKSSIIWPYNLYNHYMPPFMELRSFHDKPMDKLQIVNTPRGLLDIIHLCAGLRVYSTPGGGRR